MRLYIILCFCLIATIPIRGNNDGLKVACRVADHIVNMDSCAMVERSPGVYKINSKYFNWRYANGVLDQALLYLWDATGNQSYKNFVMNHYRFIFNHKKLFLDQYNNGIRDNDYDGFVYIQSLDNCGAITAGLIKTYRLDKNKEYFEFINKVSDYILNKQQKLADGTFCRGDSDNRTVWLDDLYMSVSFLSSMGELTNDSKYYDCAVNEVLHFYKLLFDNNEDLYYHCYYCNSATDGVAHWGRANGWSLMAQVSLLSVLPKSNKDKNKLLGIFRHSVDGIARYQSLSGLWHQLLDRNDSYEEISCSAMFAYAIAKGVNEGWLSKDYSSIALSAWDEIKKYITPKGEVENICIGTGISRDLAFYYRRPKETDDLHGFGPVIMAGIEISKMKQE
jgi:unsaturated rhamnogalacturonyl hydrolase